MQHLEHKHWQTSLWVFTATKFWFIIADLTEVISYQTAFAGFVLCIYLWERKNATWYFGNISFIAGGNGELKRTENLAFHYFIYWNSLLPCWCKLGITAWPYSFGKPAGHHPGLTREEPEARERWVSRSSAGAARTREPAPVPAERPRPEPSRRPAPWHRHPASAARAAHAASRDVSRARRDSAAAPRLPRAAAAQGESWPRAAGSELLWGWAGRGTRGRSHLGAGRDGERGAPGAGARGGAERVRGTSASEVPVQSSPSLSAVAERGTGQA